jgi:hypothetical protein
MADSEPTADAHTEILALAIVVLAIVIVFTAFQRSLPELGRVGRWPSPMPALSAALRTGDGVVGSHGIGVAALWVEALQRVGWCRRRGRSRAHQHHDRLWLVVLVTSFRLGSTTPSAASRRWRTDAARVVLSRRTRTAARLRKYLLIRTQMSLATGVLVWALAYLAGLQT